MVIHPGFSYLRYGRDMKALIAMSGGVDSSVAAKLTLEAGYDCVGCTMKLFDTAEENNADDAR